MKRTLVIIAILTASMASIESFSQNASLKRRLQQQREHVDYSYSYLLQSAVPEVPLSDVSADDEPGFL